MRVRGTLADVSPAASAALREDRSRPSPEGRPGALEALSLTLMDHAVELARHQAWPRTRASGQRIARATASMRQAQIRPAGLLEIADCCAGIKDFVQDASNGTQ